MWYPAIGIGAFITAVVFIAWRLLDSKYIIGRDK